MAGASERLSKCAEVPTNNRLGRAPADVMSRVFHPRFLPFAIGLFYQPPWAPSEISGRGKVDISTTRSDIVILNGNVGDTASHVILFHLFQDRIVLLVVFSLFSVFTVNRLSSHPRHTHHGRQ